MKKKERQKKPIISGHLFLNKEDKKAEKKALQNFFLMNGSERQRKQETKRNNRDKQPKGWKKRQIKKHPNKGSSSKTIGERRKQEKQDLQNEQK